MLKQVGGLALLVAALAIAGCGGGSEMATIESSGRATAQAVATETGLPVYEVEIDPTSQTPVSPDSLTVQRHAVILFSIAPAVRERYRFASQPAPIVVEQGGDNFDEPVLLSDYTVKLVDRMSSKGGFKYSIWLIDKSTGEPVYIDPIIKNGET